MKHISENLFRIGMLLLLSFSTGIAIAVAQNIIEVGYPNSFLKIDEFCVDCIYSRHIKDVDDEDIENDTNTYVDIAGDDMTGPLYTPNVSAINGTFDNTTTADLYVDNIFGGSDFNVWDSFSMNWETISETELNNTIINNGTATNFNMTNYTGFPNPKFDSGRIIFNPGDKKLIRHNVGGNASNYRVEVDGYSDAYLINKVCDGSRQLSYGVAGYWWSNLNSTHIILWRHAQDISSEYLRVRIWEYDYSTGGTEIITLETNAVDTDIFPRSGVYNNMTLSGNANVGGNLSVDGTSEFHNNAGEEHQGVLINDTSGTDQHHALDIIQDANGFGATGAIHIITEAKQSTANGHTDGIFIEANLVNFSDGAYHALGLTVFGNENGVDADAIYIAPEFEHIIHMGSLDVIDAAWYKNSTKTYNVTNMLKSVTNTTDLFETDNSELYIGDDGTDGNFTDMSFALSRTATLDLNLEFYYCNFNHAWTSLPTVKDSTGGFTSSGTISFINPSDRGNCSHDLGGTQFDDAVNYTYIGIRRTRNVVLNTPIENITSINGATDYFILTKDFIDFKGRTSAPVICGSATLWTTYFDEDNGGPCFCDGTDFVQFDDWSTTCS